ncbi:alpha-amylase family protein [Gordonia polyisoprenivorans]|uniref:alpha-amylase family protein n=1 Tax=Gordonia polyisoprenivorans TaxID=84595 RepID=UPI001AD795AB|nr:alpha-amylase family protein [Gordonia polyisoprenivorans]QTI67601.1 alpha-amylase family protein [Gordonia polyisoprenivorans]
MRWTDHAIWWHVYPLGFCGAPIRDHDATPAPRLRRLLNWLDYAVELGASGLLLGPVFASQAHGYDVVDPFRIDPRLGRQQDFDDLVAQCRARGLRVVLDGVFSHVGDRHPAVLRALHEGPGTETDMFDIDWAADGGPRPRVFEGHSSLVRLNHASQRTADHAVAVMNHWLDRGVDGWRLDAAYSVPVDFWARVLPEVRGSHGDAWFLGEVIHGDYRAFVAASGVDSVTQYELWKAIWSAITDRNLFELNWALVRHNDFLARFVPNTFVGNHDVTRIASLVGPDHAIVAAAILLTVGGIPSVYSGDEQGFTGLKQERVGGDDAVRPAFPDTPAGLADWGHDIMRAHQDLIGLRRRHPWLVTARTESLTLTNTRYGYRSSAVAGGDWIDVHIDLDDRPHVRIDDAAGVTLWSSPG